MSRPVPKHMSKCPLHGGLPVPAIVATLKGHIALAASKWRGFTHMTEWVPEATEPDFGKYDEEKLRRCIAGGYCHVCTGPVSPRIICDPSIRYASDLQLIDVDGRLCPMTIKPWVCAGCLQFAVHNCPPLRKAMLEGRGLVAFIDEFRLVSTYWQPANPGDPVPPPGSKVLSFIKVAIVKARYWPLDGWAGRFAP